ncbi:MAG: DUF2065 domain-containing protein [Gammaproteobacteria bacterium]|nr:DUF2065 domain-containing protein [Gammaproteobacteria bacterium]
MLHHLGLAIALLLIIEGVFPFLSPDGVRKALAAIHQLNDMQLRFAGLTCMLLGVVLLYIVNR